MYENSNVCACSPLPRPLDWYTKNWVAWEITSGKCLRIIATLGSTVDTRSWFDVQVNSDLEVESCHGMPWELMGNRCKSWRWRIYAWVRVGPVSCVRACFFASSGTLFRVVSWGETSFRSVPERLPALLRAQHHPWGACSKGLRRSLFVFALVPVVSSVPRQIAPTHRQTLAGSTGG